MKFILWDLTNWKPEKGVKDKKFIKAFDTFEDARDAMFERNCRCHIEGVEDEKVSEKASESC